jgi:formylglycine-generating enzyme required for sulfatase activity
VSHRAATAALFVTLTAIALPLVAADAPRTAGTVFRDCDACPEMVVIPAGHFVMGNPAVVARAGVDVAEAGPVVIQVPRAFALGRLEITRREFAHFVAQTGHEQRLGCRTWDPALKRFNEDARRGWQNPATPVVPGDDHPVSCVAFADALAYVQWLARTTGKSYRLPSESEWEYAARAGTATWHYWGDEPEDGCEHANTYDVTADAAYRLGWPHAGCRDGRADLSPVGAFQANPFGLHDMIGNVQEWVQDCATGSHVGRPRDARAWEWLGGCGRRIQRGGSWLTPPDRSRSSFRGDAPADDRSDDTGFRVAMDLEPRDSGVEDR